MALGKSVTLFQRIREILESARATAARSVNTTQVLANWLIGREIVEEEQKGRSRAEYGEGLLRELSIKLQDEYGTGYGLTNLKLFKKFYLLYRELLAVDKGHSLRDLSLPGGSAGTLDIGHSVRGQFPLDIFRPADTRFQCEETWSPGSFHPNLSWTHYRTLLRVDKSEARAFYEIEAVKNNWSARELERQINCLLFERLALSRDKKGCGQGP